MMYFQIFFVICSAKIANFRIFSKGYFTVFCLMFISSCLTAVAAVSRAIFFFKVLCSRFWKSKFFSTNLAVSSHGKKFFYGLMGAFWRTCGCLIFFKDFGSSKKLISTFRTDYRNFYSSKFVLTLFGTKNVFMLFDFPRLRFNLNAALAAINFHIQPCNTCEVL